MNAALPFSKPITCCVLVVLIISLPTYAQNQPAAAKLIEWREPITGMEFVAAPAGCYQMGNTQALTATPDPHLRETGLVGLWFADEAPVHSVCVDAFWIGRQEVTAAQWQTVMGSPPPHGSGSAPASGINWHQARSFIERLNELGTGQIEFRLPTEAEWEYTCISGGHEPSSSDAPFVPLTNAAWYHASLPIPTTPQPVGQLNPNFWGLTDTLGNVWEWVADSYAADAYLYHSPTNPLNDAAVAERVIRGASYRSMEQEVRCSSRSYYAVDDSLPQIGLRVAGSGQP